jgi:hypothetical protein
LALSLEKIIRYQEVAFGGKLKFTGNGKRGNGSRWTWREGPRSSGASDDSAHLRTNNWGLGKMDVKSKLEKHIKLERKSTLKQIIPETV